MASGVRNAITDEKPQREIPGSYGLPVIGAIIDRIDFFKRGANDFFKKRVEKLGSTVLRVNMPPGPPISSNPRVIALLDAKSFPVLFDVSRVEKKDVFTGTYVPKTDFTGGYRVLSYLDPSEERHTQLKNFLFKFLSLHHDRYLSEFHTASDELWNSVESEISSKGKADFNTAADQMALNFLLRSFTGTDPVAGGIGEDGPTMIKKWVFFQLAPITSAGLPLILEEILYRTFRLPFCLLRDDYKKLCQFFSNYAGDSLDVAEKLGVGRDEACHNLLFAVCFNTWGGLHILLPSMFKRVGQAGAELHGDLAEEVRAAVEKNNGKLTLSALESMELLQSTVYEALRIDPPVRYQYGHAKQDLTIESHDAVYTVRKGEMLFGYQPFATHDSHVFEDPDEFLPRRFVGSDGQKLLRYVVWSNGPETAEPSVDNKQCAGKDFIVLVARLVLAELFLRYDSFEVSVSESALGSSVSITSVTKPSS